LLYIEENGIVTKVWIRDFT